MGRSNDQPSPSLLFRFEAVDCSEFECVRVCDVLCMCALFCVCVSSFVYVCVSVLRLPVDSERVSVALWPKVINRNRCSSSLAKGDGETYAVKFDA